MKRMSGKVSEVVERGHRFVSRNTSQATVASVNPVTPIRMRV
jgi:hypothetical protein